MKDEINDLTARYGIDEILIGLANYLRDLIRNDEESWIFLVTEKKLRQLAKELRDL